MAQLRITTDALRKTLNLPRTRFPMRANAAVREAEAARRCTAGVYEWQQRAQRTGEPFVLHDGPPYANGSLHIGHFMNKVRRGVRLFAHGTRLADPRATPGRRRC